MSQIDHDEILLHRALEAEERQEARSGLLAFTQWTKPNYEVNWHHKELCGLLDKFARGEIRFLMVFLPPRTGKSELVSRRLPAFIQGLNPDAEILSASYNASLASEMTSDVQKIMDSDEYRELFPKTVIPQAGKKKQGYIRSSKGHDVIHRRGKYRSGGIDGSFTGKGANFLIIDDPFKNRKEADSPTRRETVWNAYKSSLRTRLEKGGSVLITLTRWHEDDLAGRIEMEMKNDPDFEKFVTFSFPMIKEDDSNPLDPRELGEPLWPEKYDLDECKRLKKSVGAREWSALYQQKPTSSGGAIIQRRWTTKRYRELPSRIDEFVLSWDMSFKDSDGSDYVVGMCWAKAGAEYFAVDLVRDRMGFVATIQALRDMSKKHPKAFVKLVEDKANGSAAIDSLKKEIPGLIAVEPNGSKESRVNAVAPAWEAGNVLLPEGAPWVADFVEEVVAFPRGAHDDQCDAMSQALLRFMGKASSHFSQKMVPGSMKTIVSRSGEKKW